MAEVNACPESINLDSLSEDCRRFISATEEFRKTWTASDCACPNVADCTDELLGKFVDWSKHCNLNFLFIADSSIEAQEWKPVRSFVCTVADCIELPRAQSCLGCRADEAACAWSRRYTSRLLTITQNLLSELRRCKQEGARSSDLLRPCLSKLLYTCGSHWDVENAWCSDESSQMAQNISSCLCEIYVEDSIGELLSRHSGTHLLNHLRQYLGSDSWRDFAQAVEVVLWYAGMTSPKSLESNLSLLTPMLLRLVDEGEAGLDLSIRGASALHRLVSSSTEAELKRHGHLLVMHDAIKRHTYSRDASFLTVILPLHTTLSALMSSWGSTQTVPAHRQSKPIHSQPNVIHVPGLEWNALDDYFDHLLFSALSESRWELRRVYISAVWVAVPLLSVRAARHLRRLNELIVAYLEVEDMPDEECRFACLAVLRHTSQRLWPRFTKPMTTIKALLKLCADLSEDKAEHPCNDDKATTSTDPPPKHWLEYCSRFDVAGNPALLTCLSGVALQWGGEQQRMLRCYLLAGAVECLAVLARCSQQTSATLHKLPETVEHAGVRQCALCAVKLDVSGTE